MNASLDHLDVLLSRYIDGGLTTDETAELRDMIGRDTAALDRYIDLLTLDADTRWSLGVVRSERPVAPKTPLLSPPEMARVKASFKPTPTAYGIAAALLLTAAVAIYVYAVNPKSETRNPKSTAPIATLIGSTAPGVFINDDFAREGGEYPSGSYAIESGSAEFLLDSRVTVKLSGATRLRMHNPMRASLEHGSARFHCPDGAEGFTVHLPGGIRVVDLGTRFVTTVRETSDFLVTVEEGTVEVHVPDRAPRVVVAGEVATIDPTAAERVAVSKAQRILNVNFGRLSDGDIHGGNADYEGSGAYPTPGSDVWNNFLSRGGGFDAATGPVVFGNGVPAPDVEIRVSRGVTAENYSGSGPDTHELLHGFLMTSSQQYEPAVSVSGLTAPAYDLYLYSFKPNAWATEFRIGDSEVRLPGSIHDQLVEGDNYTVARVVPRDGVILIEWRASADGLKKNRRMWVQGVLAGFQLVAVDTADASPAELDSYTP